MAVYPVSSFLVDVQGLENSLVDQVLVMEEEFVDVGGIEFLQERVG